MHRHSFLTTGGYFCLFATLSYHFNEALSLTLLSGTFLQVRPARHGLQRRPERQTPSRLFSTSKIINGNVDKNRMQNQSTSPAGSKMKLKLLLIDHYDSFTYNLYDMLAQLTVEPPVVLAKDAYEAWPSDDDDDDALFRDIDGIVLSPGPGSPHDQPDFSKQAISNNPHLPILGVCLGHQLLALVYGGEVDLAPIPIHGQDHRIYQSTWTSNITTAATVGALRSCPLLADLPSSWRAVRYHSLAVVPESLPSSQQNRKSSLAFSF